jgi:hypothetical protein
MFNSGILDVALGLTFIYLVLSLVCTAISEIIEAKLRMRSVDLERGIRELLGGADQIDLAKQFYDHPLIFSLFLDHYDTAAVDRNTKRYARSSKLPSYIPRRNFALALMDIVLPPKPQPGGGASVSGAAGATPPTPAAGAAAVPGAAPALAAAAAVAPQPAAGAPKSLQPFRDAVALLQNEKLRGALLPLVDAAADDVAKARENIEDWFDSAMDRVSGWYKRRVQWIVLGLGLVLAIASNADTIAIGNALSRDISMRNSLVAAAQEYAKPSTAPAQPSADGAESIEACKRNQNAPECRVAKNLKQIERLGLPVGWDRGDSRTVPDTFGGWLVKAIGLLLTGIAISMGAPWWFEMLNKMIVVRSTVKPREKSPEEPPLDRPKG